MHQNELLIKYGDFKNNVCKVVVSLLNLASTVLIRYYGIWKTLQFFPISFPEQWQQQLPSLGQIFFPSGTLFFPPQCKLGQFPSLPAVGVLWLFFSSNMQTFCKLQTSLQHMTTDSALCRRLQLGTLLQLLR